MVELASLLLNLQVMQLLLILLPSLFIKRVEIVVAEDNAGSSNILLQMFDAGCAWDGQEHRTPLEDPGQCDAAGSRVVLVRNRLEDRAGLSEAASRQWEPGADAPSGRRLTAALSGSPACDGSVRAGLATQPAISRSQMG